MCGPSSSMKSLAGQEASFANLLQQDFGTRFAGQTETLASLNSVLQGLQTGKLLPGFDAATLAALNTSAINQVGSNYANAARAVGGQLAGRGGDSGLESGVEQQIRAGLASAGAGQLSKEQLGIRLANQQQAQQNTATFLGGMNALAGQQNPLGYAGAGIKANENAFGEANTVNQQNNQMGADIFGGITALAGGFLSPLMNRGQSGGGFGGGGGANPPGYNPGDISGALSGGVGSIGEDLSTGGGFE